LPAAHGIVSTVCAELRELNMGDWDGRLFSEIKSSFPEEFFRRGEDIANYRPSQGESFADCRDRVVPWFERIAQKNERNILCVGHAGVNRLILSHVLGIPLARVFCIEQSYGCINLIAVENSGS
jgi:broad specificity phosphatase PhoE